jgi:GntR family transcriptional regulator
MEREWHDDQPIYRQLRDLVQSRILDGALGEGEALPSVRQVSADYRINPVTVLKAYQELVDEELIETRRGRGMFVKPGARERLLESERRRFLTEQWPRIVENIQRLGLSAPELLQAVAAADDSPADPEKET